MFVVAVVADVVCGCWCCCPVAEMCSCKVVKLGAVGGVGSIGKVVCLVVVMLVGIGVIPVWQCVWV